MAVTIESIKLENVTFGYEGRPAVFERLDFEVPQTPIVWLHGQTGMGKSSLLKILAGLLTPQSGHYWLNGADALQMSFREFLPYRLSIGYSFEAGGLLANRTIFENLLLPLTFHRLCPEGEAVARVTHWMERFRLNKVRDQRPFAVTGGQRKAAVLLRAFIHHPQLVLLDDATTGLKEETLQAFVELIEECISQHGLKHILFCGEQELPVKTVRIKKMEMSHQPKITSGAA
jgi:ABC-type transporter Mla maintaining outer membrane lipid asymmetry ATPase subunit MlaF